MSELRTIFILMRMILKITALEPNCSLNVCIMWWGMKEWSNNKWWLILSTSPHHVTTSIITLTLKLSMVLSIHHNFFSDWHLPSQVLMKSSSCVKSDISTRLESPMWSVTTRTHAIMPWGHQQSTISGNINNIWSTSTTTAAF